MCGWQSEPKQFINTLKKNQVSCKPSIFERVRFRCRRGLLLLLRIKILAVIALLSDIYSRDATLMSFLLQNYINISVVSLLLQRRKEKGMQLIISYFLQVRETMNFNKRHKGID